MFYHESNKHCSQSLGEQKNLQRLNQASPHSTACGGLTCHFDSLPLCPRVLLDHFIRMADCILECRLQTWCPVWNCPEWLWMSLALHARENNSKAITLCRELACLLWKLPEAIANLSGTTLEIASSSDTLDPAPTLQPGWGQGWYDLFTEPWECYEGLLPTTGSSPLPPWPPPSPPLGHTHGTMEHRPQMWVHTAFGSNPSSASHSGSPEVWVPSYSLPTPSQAAPLTCSVDLASTWGGCYGHSTCVCGMEPRVAM